MLSEQAKKLLKSTNFAWATVVLPDGSLHSTVVCVDLDGEDIVFTTEVGRVKELALRENPTACVAVLDSNSPFHTISVSGTAVVEPDLDGVTTDRIAVKYWGREDYTFRRLGEDRVVVRVRAGAVRYTGPPNIVEKSGA